MITLSSDVGFGRYGWVLSNSNNLVKYGCIETNSSWLFEKRLYHIYEILENLIKSNLVELLIYEEPVGVKGDNGYKLAQVVGLINILAVKYDTKLIAYSPSRIKKTVTGDAKAPKAVVEKIIKDYYNITEKLIDDTADAISVFHAYRLLSQKC